MRLKLTQAARKHRLGAARIAYVIANVEPTRGARPSGEREFSWIGPDDRGLELEIVGVLINYDGEESMLVIHAMPTA